MFLIPLGRFHMVLEHRTNLWTNDEMGEIEGSWTKGEECGVLAKEEDRTEG